MSSIIKKIGTIRLNSNAGVKITDVIHTGSPKYIRIAEVESNKSYKGYELYVEEGGNAPKKKETSATEEPETTDTPEKTEE